MAERDGFIPGVPCWVDTPQPDPKAALPFYEGVFGWEFEDVMPPGSPGQYCVGRIRGLDAGAVGSQPPGQPTPVAWNTYVWVESADDAAQKARDAGGGVLMDPFDVMDAGRMAVLADPEGAVFCVWQANQHRGAGIVNEHGSINFNTLNSRDVDGAKAFYRSVFGWETLDLGGGQMWTLPGYGDYLEGLTPGLREGMKEMGAPKGFEDVVAAVNQITGDEPPAWGVTFAVDDADAAAAKASELGGRVIAPPFDAPWVRMTVLADPQGATFIASKFVPENKDLAPAEGTTAGAA